MDVVAHTGCNEVILVGIAPIDQELSHSIAHRCLLDMLSKRPPAVVPHLFKTTVRTIEEGHVLRHPLPCFNVGNSLYDVFVFHRVEVVHVMLVVVVTQECGCVADSSAIGIDGFRTQSSDGKRGFRFALASILKCPVPIGRRVDIRETTLITRAEHHTLNALYGSEEHTLTSLLAIDIDFCHATTDA